MDESLIDRDYFGANTAKIKKGSVGTRVLEFSVFP